MPTALNFGAKLSIVRWINARIGAAALRRWLDRHPGVRTLRLRQQDARVALWLGEDFTTTIVAAPANVTPAVRAVRTS